MKKYIATLVLAALPFISFAQSAFSKFQDADGVESVIINENFFKMAGSINFSTDNAKAQRYADMVKNINNLEVFITKEKKQCRAIKSTMEAYLKSNTLQKLMSVNDKGARVSVYVKEGDKPEIVKEALIFVEDSKDEVVLLSFTGNLNLNELKSLK